MLPTRTDAGRLLPFATPPAWVSPPPGAAGDTLQEPGELGARELWRVIVRRKWTVVATLLVAVVATAIGTAQVTPIYRGMATVQIDRQPQKIVNYESTDPGAAEFDFNNSFINTYIEALKSRALAERVVDQLGLRGPDEGAATARHSPWLWLQPLLGAGTQPLAQGDATEPAREGAIDSVMAALQVDHVRNSRIVRITFDSPDPQLAAGVANQLAQTFTELNLERRMEAASYAKTFLEDRLEQVKAHLEDSERKLVGFARRQAIVAINEKQDLSTAKLDQVQQELGKVQMDRIRLESTWRELDAGAPLSQQVLDNAVIQDLKKSRTKLEVDYEDQLKVFKPAFPKMQQLRAQIDELQAKIDAEVSALRSASRADLDAAIRREQMLTGLLAQTRGEVLTGQDNSIDYNILKRDVDTNRNLYDGLLQRLKEVGVAGGIETNNIWLVDKAQVPSAPYKPNLQRNLILAVAVGFVLGILLAFACEQLDDTFRDPEDIERTLGLPVLGVVPLAEGALASTPNGLATASLLAPRSMCAEAYRSMRTALQFSTGEGAPVVIAITSAVPGEGKTTSAINLATAFASTGGTVLLIDADLRNPSLHTKLDLEGGVGLSNYLVGQMSVVDVTRAGPAANLFVIPAGHLPPNPAELLGSPRMAALIESARERFTHVIIDSPPVLSIADGLVIGTLVDATILAVGAESTRKSAARDALKRLRHVRVPVVGGLLTKYNARGRSNSYYRYYYYGDQNTQRLAAS